MKPNKVDNYIEHLQNMKHTVTPGAEWVAKNRAALLQHIARTTEDVPVRTFSLVYLWSALSLIMPQRTVYAVVRPAVIFVLSVSVGTAGWFTTVSASLNSLPGDALYPVKLATEHTQVAVIQAIQGDSATAELRLSLAARRADEVNRLVEGPLESSAKEERVKVAVDNLKAEVKGASENLAAAQQSDPANAVAIAKVIDRKASEIQQSLQAADMHISAADTVALVQQLQDEAVRVRLSESSVASSTNAGVATSSIALDVITVMVTSTTSTPEVRVVRTAPIEKVEDSSVQNTVQPDFPERPAELAPNVVDTNTPISIEMSVADGG